MKNAIIVILAIVCICLGIYNSFVNEPQKPSIITEIDTVIVTDTIKITEYIPKYNRVVIYMDRFKDVDTSAILKDYFSKYYYSDTIINDSALFVLINDTITQNNITYRKPIIRRSYPIINNTTTITKINPENGIYVGGFAGFENYGISAEYKLDNNIFGVMYGNNGLAIKYSRKLTFNN